MTKYVELVLNHVYGLALHLKRNSSQLDFTNSNSVIMRDEKVSFCVMKTKKPLRITKTTQLPISQDLFSLITMRS